MPSKKAKPGIPIVDLPDVSETFADSIGGIMTGDGIVRIELRVGRALLASENATPKMKKFTAARIVLTHECAANLCNTLYNLLSTMEAQNIKSNKMN